MNILIIKPKTCIKRGKIMEMTQRELNEIIENHELWMMGVEEGIRADLRCADLRCADLRCVDLNGVILNGADLRCADLRGAYLPVDLKGTDLRNADLRGAYLPEYMYQVTGCGSANRPTTYDLLNNQIICGCWVCSKGNTLENFEKRIEDVYGENGTKPNEKYYQEYMSAIKFFKEMRKLNAKRR